MGLGQTLLVPDKPAGILPGWPEKPGHVEVYKLSMPGGVLACLPGVDSATPRTPQTYHGRRNETREVAQERVSFS